MTERSRPVAGLVPVPGAQLYYEAYGAGPALVLLHAGLVDSRMWDEQVAMFATRYRVIRYDLRGSGRSSAAVGPFAHHADLRELLRALAIPRAHLVGVSGGAAVAIDFALAYPAAVEVLVSVSPGLFGYCWSTEISMKMEPLRAALRVGDVAAAVEARLRVWTDGPRRTPDLVDAVVRTRIGALHASAFHRALTEGAERDALALAQPLRPLAVDRLSEIQASTTVLVGDNDEEDILAISRLLEAGIAGARRVVVHGAGHMVHMEQPTHFNNLVLRALAAAGPSKAILQDPLAR